MRTANRLAVSAAVLGGGLLLASPAAAQESCEYPFDCPPVGGGNENPATGGGDETPTNGVVGQPVGGSGGGSTVNATSLPFTGGEVTLLALVGTAALGGGIALTVAGRKRATT